MTLRGGGLFVVDPRSSPMRIVAEYDRATIHGNGCGGLETDGKMYVNSGGGTAAQHGRVRRLRVRPAALPQRRGRAVCFTPTPNTPAPKLVVSQDDREHTDSHGAALTGHGRYLWVADRAGNRIVVIATETRPDGRRVPAVGPAQRRSVAGPAGRRRPAATASTSRCAARCRCRATRTPRPAARPGVGVIDVESGGRRGELRAIARISNVDAGGVDRADPHALRVRMR